MCLLFLQWFVINSCVIEEEKKILIIFSVYFHLDLMLQNNGGADNALVIRYQ